MHKSKSSYRTVTRPMSLWSPTRGSSLRVTSPGQRRRRTCRCRTAGRRGAGLEVLGDSAYGSGPVLAALEDQQHHAVIKPWPLHRNPRLGDDQFNRDDFDIDYDARTVTCPNDETVPINKSGRAAFGSRCKTCPLRSRCTASTRGRTLQIGEHDQLLAQARTDWRDRRHTDDYRQHRPMVERSIAWLVRNGHRRVRYRGVTANRIGLGPPSPPPSTSNDSPNSAPTTTATPGTQRRITPHPPTSGGAPPSPAATPDGARSHTTDTTTETRRHPNRDPQPQTHCSAVS